MQHPTRPPLAERCSTLRSLHPTDRSRRHLTLLVAAAAVISLCVVWPRSAAATGWAVIVNGDDTAMHRGNVTAALEALESRGWKTDQIRLLGAVEDGVLSERSMADLRASRRQLTETFEEIARLSDPADPVLLYWTGHGTRFAGRLSVQLDRGGIGLGGIEKALEQLQGRDLVLVVDVCFSGLLSELEYAGRLTVVSATDDDHEVLCTAFARPFWSAVAWAGTDLDGDGDVRLSEVWQTTRDAIPPSTASDAPRPQLVGDASWFSFSTIPQNGLRVAAETVAPRPSAGSARDPITTRVSAVPASSAPTSHRSEPRP